MATTLPLTLPAKKHGWHKVAGVMADTRSYVCNMEDVEKNRRSGWMRINSVSSGQIYVRKKGEYDTSYDPNREREVSDTSARGSRREKSFVLPSIPVVTSICGCVGYDDVILRI